MGEESAVQLLCGYIKAVQYFFEKVKYHGAIRQGASLARLVGSFAVKNLAESCGVFDPRGSRQMDMQACPLGSLPAEIKNSVCGLCLAGTTGMAISAALLGRIGKNKKS